MWSELPLQAFANPKLRAVGHPLIIIEVKVTSLSRGSQANRFRVAGIDVMPFDLVVVCLFQDRMASELGARP